MIEEIKRLKDHADLSSEFIDIVFFVVDMNAMNTDVAGIGIF